MTDENIKSWKCGRRKMLQADSVGRVRLKLIVRDFSDLLNHGRSSRFLRSYFENRVHVCRKNRCRDIFKADSAQSKRTTFLPKRKWHKTRKAWGMSRNNQLTQIKVFCDLKTDVWKSQTLNIQVFVFDYRRISKTQIFENLWFLKSKFSIFTIKHDVWKSRIFEILVFDIPYR